MQNNHWPVWLCMTALAPTAWATNWAPVLKNTPLQAFGKADVDALSREGAAFLGSDATLLDWRNPQSGAGGSFKLLASSERKGRPCKIFQVTFYTRREPAQVARIRACREIDGWRLIDAP